MCIHTLVHELNQYNAVSKYAPQDVHASRQLTLVKLNEIDSADEKHNHGSTALWSGKK